MPEYYCECCEFKTKLKPNYERHLLTKKHLSFSKKSTESQQLVNQKSTILMVTKRISIFFVNIVIKGLQQNKQCINI